MLPHTSADTLIGDAAAGLTDLSRRWAVAALLLLAAVLGVARLHTYDEPIERDIMLYAVIGHEMLAGRPLYSDLWEHKPPLTLLTFAGADLIVGYGPTQLYVLNVGFTVLTLLGVYAAGRNLARRRAAGLWAALFWTLICGDLYLQANQPNVEVFLNAAMTWALALMLPLRPDRLAWPRCLAVGAMLALASLYKHNIVLVAAGMAMVHLLASLALPGARLKALAQTLLIALPGALAWSALMAYFALTHRLAIFTDTLFTFNRYYAGYGLKPPGFAYAAQHTFWKLLHGLDPANLAPWHTWFLAPLLLLALGGLVHGLRRVSPRRWSLWLGTFIGAWVMVTLPGQYWPHYYQMYLPALAIAAGAAVAAVTPRSPAGPSRSPVAPAHAWTRPVILLAILTTVFLTGYHVRYYRWPAEEWSRRKYGPVFSHVRTMGQLLDSMLLDGQTFYQWGAEPGLYFEARRHPPTGVFFPSHVEAGPLAATLTQRVLSDLEHRPPALCVITRGASDDILASPHTPRPIHAWINQYYDPAPLQPMPQAFILLRPRQTPAPASP